MVKIPTSNFALPTLNKTVVLMKHQSTENSNLNEEKDCNKNADQPQEIRVVVQSNEKKPGSPKWWDVLGWILRFVIALGTLLKLLKDKD